MNYLDIPKVDIDFIGNGVENCGSSCFFNSTNQMLFHIVEFREFLIAHKYLFKGNNIILNLINLFEKMKNGSLITRTEIIDKGTKKNLREFYYDIQQFYFNNGRKGVEEDAGELLWSYMNGKDKYRFSINQTINDSNILINKNESSSGNNLEFNDYYYKYNIDLPIYDFMVIKNKSYECKNGKTTKIREETNEFMNFITIDYDSKKSINIDTYTEEVERSGYCQDDNKMTKNVKYICKKYLIIFIKREFEDENGDQSLNYGPIKDFKNDLTITDHQKNQYNLIGTICKSGDQGGGHWWYYHKVNNIWYEYNDDNCYPNRPPRQNNIIYALFRLYDALYRIPIYRNIDELSTHALIQASQYVNNETLEDNTKINHYIKILVYYVNKINQNNNLIHNQLLRQVRQHFIDLLQPLLI
jgi:ubiquitin C-terminal hydrolase